MTSDTHRITALQSLMKHKEEIMHTSSDLWLTFIT